MNQLAVDIRTLSIDDVIIKYDDHDHNRHDLDNSDDDGYLDELDWRTCYVLAKSRYGKSEDRLWKGN